MATLLNNFPKFKQDFKTDTGLDANPQNMALYIQYVQTRMTDYIFQEISLSANQTRQAITQLPADIRLQIAEMLRSHEVIKELLRKKP